MSPNDLIRWTQESLLHLVAEGWLLFAMLVLILLSFSARIPKASFKGIAVGVVAIELFLLALHWPVSPVSLLAGALRQDNFASIFRTLLSIGTLITLLMEHRLDRRAEYYIFLLSALLGSHLLVMSTSFVMLVLSLELISISSYVLVLDFDTTRHSTQQQQAEGAWKYYLFGSASTAIMLMGLSYVFGITHTLQFTTPEFLEAIINSRSPLLLIGAVMTMAGFLFKLGLVPFHFWLADVYESSSLPIAAFLSVVPKLAAFAALTKFTASLNVVNQSIVAWPYLLAWTAIAGILLGSLGALNQTNARRMMAFSSIAQSGFLISALVTFSPEGVQIGIFYAAVFLVMNYLAFISLQGAEHLYGSSQMKDFAGWGYQSGWHAVALTVSMISLTGLPPVAGFMAKFFLFTAIWSKFSQSGDMVLLTLFVVGLLATVASLFFYLRIPYFAFLHKGPEPVPVHQKNGLWPNLLTALLVLLLLYLFFQPALLMGWANKVNFVL